MPKETLTCDCSAIHEDIINKVKQSLPKEEERLPVYNFFKVLGDKTRIRILMALDIHEMCVCDLSVLMDMTKSSISHQLKLLKDVGLVKFRRVGKNVFYSLDDDHVKDIIEKAFEHTQHICNNKEK